MHGVKSAQTGTREAPGIRSHGLRSIRPDDLGHPVKLVAIDRRGTTLATRSLSTYSETDSQRLTERRIAQGI